MSCAVMVKQVRKSRALKVAIGSLDAKLTACGSVVVAYGGGTDSTAMLIELVRRRIPINAILFADTGGELQRTYNYVKLFSLWLQQHGYPAVTWVKAGMIKRGDAKGKTETLYESLWRNQVLPPVAFNFHTCSERFKIKPQDRWVLSQEWTSHHWQAGTKTLKLIGFEVDEAYRINRTHPLILKSGKFDAHYPLVEWGWTREKCVQVIAEAGLPQPGKSACFFCPNRKEAEIRELAQEEPELLQKALDLEARALASGKIKSPEIKGLGGRKFSWAELLRRESA